MNAPNAGYLERCRKREARHLRRVERLEEAFDAANGVEAELRINKQINQAVKAASKGCPAAPALRAHGADGHQEGADQMKQWKRKRRKFTEEMARQLRRLSLSTGSHSPSDDQHCVMEALALVSGQRYTDWPVCVSDAITYMAQYLNDTTKDQRKRNVLKKLVPIVMGTAPLVTNGLIEKKDRKDPQYIKAEKKRQELIVKRATELGLLRYATIYETKREYRPSEWTQAYCALIESKKVPFRAKVELIVDLARVKKFNGQKVDDFLPPSGRLV